MQTNLPQQNSDPAKSEIQKRRQRFLAAHGIDPKQQHLAVHTLNKVQDMALERTEEACIRYLRLWDKDIRRIKPKHYEKWFTEHDAVFAATMKTQDKVTGSHSLIYCYYRKTPAIKRAFEISFKVLPQLDGKGIFRLDVDSKEIPFPANVKISET